MLQATICGLVGMISIMVIETLLFMIQVPSQRCRCCNHGYCLFQSEKAETHVKGIVNER